MSVPTSYVCGRSCEHTHTYTRQTEASSLHAKLDRRRVLCDRVVQQRVRIVIRHGRAQPSHWTITVDDCNSLARQKSFLPVCAAVGGFAVRCVTTPPRLHNCACSMWLRLRRALSTAPTTLSASAELRLYDSLSRRRKHVLSDDLIGQNTCGGRALTWYSCGPTVYDKTHVGHARNYVQVDVLQRLLEVRVKLCARVACACAVQSAGVSGQY